MRIHGYKNRELGSPVQIEYHAGTKATLYFS